jgi:hemolysin III
MLKLEDRPMVRVQENASMTASTRDISTDDTLNAATHAVGLVLSIAGAVLLIDRASSQADAWRIAGCGIFAATLISMYAASTLSHLCKGPRLRRLFRCLDQAFIYLLIAGTYTPIGLGYLRTNAGLLFLGLMWLAALWGCISKIMLIYRPEVVRVWSYLLLGWMPIIIAPWMVGVVPATALWWMLAGGMCYTVGTLFLAGDVRYRHFHAVWHVLVIVASACHYGVIFWFVAS